MVKNTYQLLNPLERARFFKTLHETDGLTLTEIAKRYNRSLSYISNTLRLLQLPDVVKEGLVSGDINEGNARALLAVKDTRKVPLLYKTIIMTRLTVRDVEKMVRQANREAYTPQYSGVGITRNLSMGQ